MQSMPPWVINRLLGIGLLWEANECPSSVSSGTSSVVLVSRCPSSSPHSYTSLGPSHTSTSRQRIGPVSECSSAPSWLPQRSVPPSVLESCQFSDQFFTVYQRFNIKEHPLGSRHRRFRQARRESDRARVPPSPRLATQFQGSRRPCPLQRDSQPLLQAPKTALQYSFAFSSIFSNHHSLPTLLSAQRYQHPNTKVNDQLRFIESSTITLPGCVGHPALPLQSRTRETCNFTSTHLLRLSSSMAWQKSPDAWTAHVT